MNRQILYQDADAEHVGVISAVLVGLVVGTLIALVLL